jgi:hypothetical protein
MIVGTSTAIPKAPSMQSKASFLAILALEKIGRLPATSRSGRFDLVLPK